jgi:hypothetical protein
MDLAGYPHIAIRFTFDGNVLEICENIQRAFQKEAK